MGRQRHLAKAPITEALVDFRTKLPEAFAATTFTTLEPQLRSDYPLVEHTRLLEGGIRISAGQVSQTTSDKGLHGAIFRTSDSKHVAQYRLDGFTFSRLKPYTSWDDVFAEAWRLWQLYRSTASPEVVSRVAVRYVNHITLPFSADLREYFEDPPTIPDGIPKQMMGFLKRVGVHDPSTKLSANLVQAFERSPDPGQMTFILDIDAYSLRDCDPSSEDLKSVFGRLRELKNQLFFCSLTEKSVEMFE